MEDTEVVKKLLSNLEDQVNEISHNLKDDILTESLKDKLFNLNKQGELDNKEAIGELNEAKLLNFYSYILVSLYFTSLKLSGSKFNNDSVIMEEINRVKKYMLRVKNAEENLNKIDDVEKENDKYSKSMLKKQLNYEPAVSHVHFKDENENGNGTGTGDKENKAKRQESISVQDSKKIVQAKSNSVKASKNSKTKKFDKKGKPNNNKNNYKNNKITKK